MADLPRLYSDQVMPAKVGTPGFDLPDLASLVRYKSGQVLSPNLTVTSASDSNNVLLPSDFSPTGRLRIVFSAQASGNTVVFGAGADPTGDLKIHSKDSILVFAGGDRGSAAINVVIQGAGSSFFWGRRSSSNGLSVYIEGDAASTIIGEDCMVAQRASIMTSDMHAIIDLNTGNWLNPRAPVVIAPHVWLGSESMIMKGVTLGFGVSVAARAVVTRDVPDFAIAGGVPAKILRSDVVWTRPSAPMPQAMKEVHSLAVRTGHALPGSTTLLRSGASAELC